MIEIASLQQCIMVFVKITTLDKNILAISIINRMKILNFHMWVDMNRTTSSSMNKIIDFFISSAL